MWECYVFFLILTSCKLDTLRDPSNRQCGCVIFMKTNDKCVEEIKFYDILLHT